MSVLHSAFASLQKVGKSLMLPVSVLPVAGILLGVGAAKFSWMPEIVSKVMEQAGGAVFGNMALLFAVGVALGFTRNDGVAALAAAVGYFIMVKTLGVIAPGTDVGVLGGILAGGVAAWAFNRFFRIELPAYLGFFSGKRAVPIITGFSAIALACVLAVVWPPIGAMLNTFSHWAAYQNPIMAFGLYGVIERALIPFGLHHIWNVPFFFEAGNCVNAAGQALTGVLTCYQSADEASRAAGNGFGQLAGGYMFKMYGLPAAAIAIWHSARPENRAKVGGIMLSAALTSFLTGITEPIEFAFLFVAPVLYVIHALLAGSAFVVTNALGMVHGTSFSHGLIDFVLLFANSQKGWLFPVIGLGYAVIYYSVFRIMIRALNLKTPGREEEPLLEETSAAHSGDALPAHDMIDAFGGSANITSLDSCITRLRIEVKDIKQVDQARIKALGATGVIVMGNGVQAIVGTVAENLRTAMEEALRHGGSRPAAPRAAAAPAPQVAASASAADQGRAEQLLAALGGNAVVIGCEAVAGNRLRLELNAPLTATAEQLAPFGVTKVLVVNERVVQLLLNDSAAGLGQALASRLG